MSPGPQEPPPQHPRRVWVFREQELGISAFVVLIGLLLIGVAAGFTVDVLLQNAHDVDVDVLGHTFTVGPGVGDVNETSPRRRPVDELTSHLA